MPGFAVNSDSTASTAASVESNVAEAGALLKTLTGQIDALLSDGLVTEKVTPEFREKFDVYKGDSQKTQDFLGQLGRFLKIVGETVDETDNQLAASL